MCKKRLQLSGKSELMSKNKDDMSKYKEMLDMDKLHNVNQQLKQRLLDMEKKLTEAEKSSHMDTGYCCY